MTWLNGNSIVTAGHLISITASTNGQRDFAISSF